MSGREDFGIARLRTLTDPRIHKAAEGYVKHRIARRETAVGAVIGHVALLGGALARDTDDGILRGDMGIAFGQATYLKSSIAEKAVKALQAAELLEPRDGGLYLNGFEGAYRGLLEGREKARRRAAERRAGEGRASGSTNQETTAEAVGPLGSPNRESRFGSSVPSPSPLRSVSEPSPPPTPFSTHSTTGFQPGAEKPAATARPPEEGACPKCNANGMIIGSRKSCDCPRGRRRALALARGKGEDEAQAARAGRARRERDASSGEDAHTPRSAADQQEFLASLPPGIRTHIDRRRKEETSEEEGRP